MDESGQVFPTSVGCADPQDMRAGLTKRELFAGMAMMGLAASPDFDSTPSGHAKESVLYAEALLAELAKEKPDDDC